MLNIFVQQASWQVILDLEGLSPGISHFVSLDLELSLDLDLV